MGGTGEEVGGTMVGNGGEAFVVYMTMAHAHIGSGP